MRIRIPKRRGRPRGRYRSTADFRLLEYLALVSMKHGIDPEKFFESIVEAWKHQKSKCKSLSIRCRKNTRDAAVFLITNSYKVVAQFPIPKHILEETSPLKRFVSTKPSRNTIPKRVSKQTMPKRAKVKHRIGDLKAGMKRINLKAQVLTVPKPKPVFTRFGESAMVTNTSIADETGTIQLTLWNKQIDSVSVGDLIQVKNAHVVKYRGEQQLRIGKGGQLNVIEKK